MNGLSKRGSIFRPFVRPLLCTFCVSRDVAFSRWPGDGSLGAEVSAGDGFEEVEGQQWPGCLG